MANKSQRRKLADIKDQLVGDLHTLANILDGSGVCPDVRPLQIDVDLWEVHNTFGWRYSLSDLIFRDVTDVKTFPAKLQMIDCRLHVEIEASFTESDDCDPLSKSAIELTLEGLDSQEKPILQSWHIDRHVEAVAGLDDDAGIGAVHPRYHLHFGGDRMKNFANSNGLDGFSHVLLLDSPRFPHPPLDGVLAIDLVISNFYPKDWKKLRGTADYRSIIERSQKRFWRPYAKALADHWEQTADGTWTSSDCWPHLLQ